MGEDVKYKGYLIKKERKEIPVSYIGYHSGEKLWTKECHVRYFIYQRGFQIGFEKTRDQAKKFVDAR